MIDLDKLEALAVAATPGPWISPAPGRVGTPDGKRTEIGIVRRTADAEFIAAADPQTVLQLVAEIRSLRTRLAYHQRLSDLLAGGAGLTGEGDLA